jgi:hypothetical protein
MAGDTPQTTPWLWREVMAATRSYFAPIIFVWKLCQRMSLAKGALH